jgi:thiamine-phosphate diphosphorylase
MSPRLPPRLLALTPGCLPAQELLARLTSAVEAGLEGVLVREPALEDRALTELLVRCREILGVERWLGVHDRAHLALALACDGVHLGFRSLPPPLARRVVGPSIAIGFSAHAHDAPEARAGADYLFLGPIRDTPSKQGLLPALGFEALAHACAISPLPIWAIGGLHPEHTAAAIESGATGLATLGGILSTATPAAATRSYLTALATTHD